MGATELIRHDDFLSVNIGIKLRNATSETVIDSQVRTIGSVPMGLASKTNLIELLEILPNGLVLSVPKYTCAEGHSLELDLSVTHLGPQPFDVRFAGKVRKFERTSEEQARITVEISKSAAGWKSFGQLFSKRQDAIQEFLKNARGY